jgi:hypothetical protein
MKGIGADLSLYLLLLPPIVRLANEASRFDSLDSSGSETTRDRMTLQMESR